MIAELEALLALAKPLAVKAGVLRHNLFGHRSSSLSYAEAFSVASVSPDDLRALTELGLRLVNLLLRTRGLGERSFHPLSAQQTMGMLRKLGA